MIYIAATLHLVEDLSDDHVPLNEVSDGDVASAGQGIVRELGVNWSRLPIAFGIAIYAFEGIGIILPVETSMKEPQKYVTYKPTKKKFNF